MEKKIKMLVSVIIPVYGVEQYLQGCVDSVLVQTYRNLEIILVDDGSKDACPQICDNYVKKDSRIRVIHKKNGGLSDARNAGIDIATGDFLTFVDSDDRIHPQMIESMINVIIKYNADIAICDYKKVSQEIEQYNENKKSNEVEEFTGIEACAKMYTEYPSFVVSCAKLYKQSLWKEKKFPKGKCHEDEFTSYLKFLEAEKIVYLKRELYCYLERQGSIMNSMYSEKRLDRFDALNAQIKLFKEKNLVDLEKQVYKRYFYFVLKGLEEVNRKQQKYLYAILKKEYRNILKEINQSKLFDDAELEIYNAPKMSPIREKIYWKLMKLKSIMRKDK